MNESNQQDNYQSRTADSKSKSRDYDAISETDEAQTSGTHVENTRKLDKPDIPEHWEPFKPSVLV